jgi:hypothetical protein
MGGRNGFVQLSGRSRGQKLACGPWFLNPPPPPLVRLILVGDGVGLLAILFASKKCRHDMEQQCECKNLTGTSNMLLTKQAFAPLYK